MELAQTLVRSVVRAFFSTYEERRIICIVDALVLHSALRDDDLSYLMGINTKDLSKTCGKLEEERLLRSHHRAEIREGKERANTRKYYYIDYRQAIDAIKWRTYKLDKAVQGEATGPVEKKEYFCTNCRREYSQLEVLDSVGPDGFICHRCQHILTFDPDRQAGGHELSTRLNNQLKFITDVLPKLDTATIPESTFDTALDAAVPVVRDAANQVAASVAVETVKPTAVKGMTDTGPQSIAISITDTDGPTDAEKEAERARKEQIAKMNALPSWHTTSTVTGLSFSGSANPIAAAQADEDDVKSADDFASDNAHEKELAEVFAMMQESARLKAQTEEEEEDDEDEDEDEEFEDVANATSPGQKRPASSGPSSGAGTPASERAAKKVKVEEPANDGDSEDDEDVQFEDV
ncbi:hypothetical protein F4818DRAFT_427908 [Hypoxylon cercidicola]|nr:hypothetical protein F4818DRAFT_427908 [Hypoxylon cercidicola]